jgi:hypothetical protein
VRKMLSLVLAGALGLVPGAGACDVGIIPKAPVPSQVKGPAELLKKTVRVEIEGKLVILYPACDGEAIIQIQAMGKTYWLTFASKELREKALTLDPAGWRVTGILEKETVHVESMAAGGGDSVKETVRVEMKGKLTVRWVRCPGSPFLEVSVEGQPYSLQFTDSTLRKLAEKLDGQVVRVKGTLTEQTVHVENLQVAEFLRLEPR